MGPALVADFFGREHAGSLVGLLFATAGSIAAFEPLGAGFLYDRLGSYALAWWLADGFNALALGLLVFTHPPEGRPGRSSAAGPASALDRPSQGSLHSAGQTKPAEQHDRQLAGG